MEDVLMDRLEFSLQHMCATVIIDHIVRGSNRPARIALDRCEHYISALNNSVPLPTAFKDLFRSLWKPVVRNLDTFQRQTSHFPIRPVRNPQGHVNVMDSTKQFLLDENVHRVLRYIIACRFCHENHISLLGQQLTQEEMSVVWNYRTQDIETTPYGVPGKVRCPMTKFWLNSCLKLVPRDGRLMHQETYNRGFEIALDNQQHVAVRFFLDRADRVSIELILGRRYGHVSEKADYISYGTRCKLFELMTPYQKNYEHRAHLFSLLDRFLIWPYQPCFLEVAERHLNEISEQVFWALLVTIAYEKQHGDKDYDYEGLFHKFSRMCVHITGGFSQENAHKMTSLLNGFNFDSSDCLLEVVAHHWLDFARGLEAVFSFMNLDHLPNSILLRRKLKWLLLFW